MICQSAQCIGNASERWWFLSHIIVRKGRIARWVDFEEGTKHLASLHHCADVLDDASANSRIPSLLECGDSWRLHRHADLSLYVEWLWSDARQWFSKLMLPMRVICRHAHAVVRLVNGSAGSYQPPLFLPWFGDPSDQHDEAEWAMTRWIGLDDRTLIRDDKCPNKMWSARTQDFLKHMVLSIRESDNWTKIKHICPKVVQLIIWESGKLSLPKRMTRSFPDPASISRSKNKATN